MGSYTGKFDFEDECTGIYTPDRIINEFKIFSHSDIIPMHFQEPKDLIPYYPYIITSSAYNKADKSGVIHLSSRSYIDEKEEESLTWTLEIIKKYYRQCKKKKVPFDPDVAHNKIAMFPGDTLRDWEKQLIERVKKYGNKATIEDIHMASWDRNRYGLYKEMVSNGWNDSVAYGWCFGWKRMVERFSDNLDGK